MSQHKVDITSLSRQERLALLEELWDSLDPSDLPLTTAQRDELDRRLEEMESDPGAGIPWEQVFQRIRDQAG